MSEGSPGEAREEARERPREKVRVMLVDDHTSFREPLAILMGLEPDLSVVAEAGTLAEARAILARTDPAVDVAVVDLNLPDGSGTDLIDEMRGTGPQVAVLVLSAYSDREHLAEAVEAGAAGVLHKSALVGEVVDAVRRLVAGEPLLSTADVVELLRLAGRRRERDYATQRSVEKLTPRELEVLHALADGLSDREIAERLYVGVGTVRNHLVSIFGKLGVNSRLQALVFALRSGVVEIG